MIGSTSIHAHREASRALAQSARASWGRAAGATQTQALDRTPQRPVEANLHWVWVGDQPLPENWLQNILETARLAPAFRKTVWTNNPALIQRSARDISGRLDIDVPAALRRARIAIRPIDELFAPMPGFTTRELNILQSLVWRDIVPPLAQRPSASDILRLLILHRIGGAYLDVDFAVHGAPPGTMSIAGRSPTTSEQQAITYHSLRASEIHGFPPTARQDPERAVDLLRRSAIRKMLNQVLLDGKLEQLPVNELGFAVLASPKNGFNNALLAARRSVDDANSVTRRALKMILSLEQPIPLTMEHAARTLQTSPHLAITPLQALELERSHQQVEHEVLRSMRRMQSERGFALSEHLPTDGLRLETYRQLATREQGFREHIARGNVSAVRIALLQASLYAGRIAPPYAPEMNLPLSWAAKRLRPRSRGELDAIREYRRLVSAPANFMTQAMTGPALLYYAIMTDPRLDIARITHRLGVNDAFQEAQHRAYAPTSFFQGYLPGDNPSLRPLEEIAYDDGRNT